MGQDKALLPWQGHPLWRIQMAKLIALKPARLLVACREEQGLHEDAAMLSDVEWLFDPPGEDLGPIAAIARALEKERGPLLVLAVDMPWMTPEFLRDHLLGQWQAGQGLFYLGQHGYEPLAGLYDPSMEEALVAAMQKGQLSLQRVIETAVTVGVAIAKAMPLAVEPLFANANTLEEWDGMSGTA
jgi:molybdopterin-guanine dinucleotide biosynthesis protein A